MEKCLPPILVNIGSIKDKMKIEAFYGGFVLMITQLTLSKGNLGAGVTSALYGYHYDIYSMMQAESG